MKNQTTKTIACVIAGLTLTACGNDPAKNLTVADMPSSAYITAGDSAVGSCTFSRCSATYPAIIDIKPLENTSGRAIYTGAIQIEYNGGNNNRSTTANIIVNFADNTIRWSGEISTNAASLRGSFNPRGQIRGTATVAGINASLVGLIGETEMIGAFTNGVDYAGGFSAFRE